MEQNKQQTAVEWLHQMILPKDTQAVFLLAKDIEVLFEQAKAMEKEQMIGLLDWMNKIASEEPMRLETDHDDIVEQYYNERYGNEQRSK
jgi:hypothetical protein